MPTLNAVIHAIVEGAGDYDYDFQSIDWEEMH